MKTRLFIVNTAAHRDAEQHLMHHVESAFADRPNVHLFPPKDPKALAAETESLTCIPDLQPSLQEAALDLADERFSWNKAVALTPETLKTNEWHWIPKTFGGLSSASCPGVCT